MPTTWEKFKTRFIQTGASVASATLEYNTPKIVHIKNKTVGAINRLVQLTIVGYIVGYAIIYEKGYQRTEDVVSAVTTKVHGLGYTDGTGIYENAGDRTWDSPDFVIPPQSPNSVFIMTNMWITNQSQGVCPETKYLRCNDSYNPCNKSVRTGNGVLTGECSDSGYCMAKGWCPVEKENKSISYAGPKLPEAVDFTIFIENTIQFPTLDPEFRRQNVHDTKYEDISKCRFNLGDDLFCPIISLGTIIGMLEKKTSFEDLAINGSVLGLQIEWNCDLDRNYNDCKPRYSARRLDNSKAIASPGFNFRFANTWIAENGTYQRQMIKAYGIRVNIIVLGEGGKFDFAALVLKIGSGIALLAIASIVSDVVILYLIQERTYYREKKYLYVSGKASIFKRNSSFGDNLLSPVEKYNLQNEFEGNENYDTNYVSTETQKKL